MDKFTLRKETFQLTKGEKLSVDKREQQGKLIFEFIFLGEGKCLLHWGVGTRREGSWEIPARNVWPESSTVFNNSALQSPFIPLSAGHWKLSLIFPITPDHRYLCFVLYFPEEERWENNGGMNFHFTLGDDARAKKGPFPWPANEIIAHETGRRSWTLMHRFNLCHTILSQGPIEAEDLATLFIWLRYSSLRQLDWQRHYNTKPRELTHAQKRLTTKIVDLYPETNSKVRELIRFLLATVGRGAEGGRGQEIRDGILHIMHRHKIKETSGHFIEEWHQKLHNNATPDDIAICEAYLAFLRSNGQVDVFNRVLEENGITRQRLASFERPLVADPDFIPFLKEGLIHDFKVYLGLLKSVHSSMDLTSAIEEGKRLLDAELAAGLSGLVKIDARESQRMVEEALGIRKKLYKRIVREKDVLALRDLLYLDIAVEERVRLLLEGCVHEHVAASEIEKLISLLLKHISLSFAGEEPLLCHLHWRRLLAVKGRDGAWHLHAHAALDRLQLMLGAITDRLTGMFQDKAETMGKEFGVAPWAIELFTQEIVRGGLLFVLARLIQFIEPKIRLGAGLTGWRIISRGVVDGLVEILPLAESQSRPFAEPTILLSSVVTGDEEIPPGVAAVITRTNVDVLAHLSVRARNAGIFFAVCHDEETFNKLLSWRGKKAQAAIRSDGEVIFTPSAASIRAFRLEPPPLRLSIVSKVTSCHHYCIPIGHFSPRNVGGKAMRLRELTDKLPSWISLPRSIAIPFGVFEKIMADPLNKDARERYEKFTAKIGQTPGKALSRIRRVVTELRMPESFSRAFVDVMHRNGLPLPSDWEKTCWTAIKRVWASKWNSRAFCSRTTYGMRHADLSMAVLVQNLVPARYAFVLHTANPISGDGGEILGEVVLGAGESLVSGHYSGSAFSFTCGKNNVSGPMIKNFPSKREILRGEGLIFRSDSNGEDLGEYAGAGLYDSVAVPEFVRCLADYSNDPLLWDDRFRNDIFGKISHAGCEIERLLGGYQDIEGAVAEEGLYLFQSRPQVALGGTGHGC